MTVHAAADVRALDANIFRTRAAVAPPLGRPEQSNDGSTSRDRQMRRPRVASDICLGATRKRVETFERRTRRLRRTRAARADDRLGQLALARPLGDD